MKTEPVKKKKKKPEQTEPMKERRRRRKKKNRTANPGEERKKKVKRWSKGAVEYCLWVPYVCLITILPLISVFITHNSKIRKLSDGNRVMDFPNNLFAMSPTIFEL